MSCFNKVSTVTANSDLDLTKHVNYTSGMILGVDDFTQEFAYLAGRDRWLARDALGFGTVSGLKVQVDKDGGKGARVMVLPGVAISPRGQFICVSSAQCAYLNEWIAANKDELKKWVKEGITSPPISSPHLDDELTLYVVLCYRDCAVDSVPIPGEPCRSEDELTAPSRIADDFSLELRFESPKQPEEEKVREFVEWLRRVKIVETGASTPIETFTKAIRAKWLAPTSPPITSPPAALQISVKDFDDYMRAAFRIWVTELRNVLSRRETGCAVEMTGGASFEDCVLLGELRVPLVSTPAGSKVSASKDVSVDEENRPFLLHLRMLQEWMLSNYSAQVSKTLSPLSLPHLPTPLPTGSTPANTLDSLSDVKVPAPKEGQVLIFEGGEWIAKTPATGGGGGGVTEHKGLSGLKSDDHLQYLLIDGTRAMAKNLDAGGNRVTNLKIAENKGEAVIFEQAIKDKDDAKGDLGGKYPSPTVVGLQGSAVSPIKPQKDNILVYVNDAWTPQQQPDIPVQPAQRAQLILPLATITRVKEFSYEIWFHIDAPGNLAKVSEFKDSQLVVFDETDTPVTFTNSKIGVKIAPGVRNVFNCALTMPVSTTLPEPEPDRMRFRFDLTSIGVEVTVPSGGTETVALAKYADKQNIKFIGSLDGKFVTVFVRGSGTTRLIQ